MAGNKRKLIKVTGLVLLLIALSGFLFICTQQGRIILYRIAAHIIHTKVNELGDNEEIDDHDLGSTEENLDFNDIGSGKYPVRREDYIKNFLILGIEEIYGAKNTDSMMIVSLDTKNNDIKLTSLMRDSYVDIPGHKKNKLNAAYAKGGISLLADTIEKNYKINIDGYASVNFKSFEKVIDILGGVEVKLSEEEAEYLNTTNYISNPKYRTVKAGSNILNGNQALGYCRIRHVNTIDNEADDYGRTTRQRQVLQQVFKKCKSYNILNVIKIADQCMDYVTSDLSENTIEYLIQMIMENNIKTIQTFRLPVKDGFDDPKVYEGVTYPLVYDWDENIMQLFIFLYGDTEEEAMESLQELKE